MSTSYLKENSSKVVGRHLTLIRVQILLYNSILTSLVLAPSTPSQSYLSNIPQGYSQYMITEVLGIAQPTVNGIVKRMSR